MQVIAMPFAICNQSLVQIRPSVQELSRLQKDGIFQKKSIKKLWTKPSKNQCVSWPCPWPSVTKVWSKSGHPFKSYRVYKRFWPFDLCDLDLWPWVMKIGWGHYFSIGSLYAVVWLPNSNGNTPKSASQTHTHTYTHTPTKAKYHLLAAYDEVVAAKIVSLNMR